MSDRQFSLDRGIKTCRRDSRRGLNNKGEGYDESRCAEVFLTKSSLDQLGNVCSLSFLVWVPWNYTIGAGSTVKELRNSLEIKGPGAR